MRSSTYEVKMSLWDAIAAAIGDATSKPFSIEKKRSLSGGCINQAFEISDGERRYFVKVNDASHLKGFSTESAALEEIIATRSVRAPQPICCSASEGQAFLVLEYIEIGKPAKGSWEMLGRQLAKMHQAESRYYGWQADNNIGSTPQPNPTSENWIIFFREHRLRHQFTLCEQKGFRFDGAEALLESMPRFFQGYSPPPSLLHGDLWSGNAAFDTKGELFIFDPCCYYGDRETDIAFTEFFGGFAPTFYEAYQETLPLDSGYAQRKDLYNLYHCLNHCRLFGSSYAAQAQSMIQKLLGV